MGLLRSEVLSTFPKPKLALASVAFAAPVPPFSIATMPEMAFAVCAENAYGTVESGLSLNSINS